MGSSSKGATATTTATATLAAGGRQHLPQPSSTLLLRRGPTAATKGPPHHPLLLLSLPLLLLRRRAPGRGRWTSTTEESSTFSRPCSLRWWRLGGAPSSSRGRWVSGEGEKERGRGKKKKEKKKKNLAATFNKKNLQTNRLFFAGGFMGAAGLSAYSASKHALRGLCDCLRLEVRKIGGGRFWDFLFLFHFFPSEKSRVEAWNYREKKSK